MIPDSAVGAFSSNSMLQVLLISCLFGIALVHIGGKTAETLLNVLEKVNDVLFKIMGYIMKLTALATFSAMAFAVSQYDSWNTCCIRRLFIAMTIACLAFVLVLAVILRIYLKLSLWKVILYIREEIMLAFATCSSASRYAATRWINSNKQYAKQSSRRSLVVPTG